MVKLRSMFIVVGALLSNLAFGRHVPGDDDAPAVNKNFTATTPANKRPLAVKEADAEASRLRFRISELYEDMEELKEKLKLREVQLMKEKDDLRISYEKQLADKETAWGAALAAKNGLSSTLSDTHSVAEPKLVGFKQEVDKKESAWKAALDAAHLKLEEQALKVIHCERQLQEQQQHGRTHVNRSAQ